MSVHMFEMHRKVLLAAVSSTLLEIGFESAEQTALETLAEMLQSIIIELGNSSRAYHELAGRTEPLFADVILALINTGVRLNELELFAKRQNKTTVPSPIQTVQAKQLNILQAGVKQDHPSHVPTHLPPFPDPHAYIRTPTHKQPVTEYEAIREKSAIQKRDIERALNKFISKTRDTDSLFLSPDIMFPLIACKPQSSPYLTSLLPKDQIFEENEYELNISPQKKPKKEKEEDEEETSKTDNDQIDNPYLRAVKLPPPKIRIKDLLTTPSSSTTM